MKMLVAALGALFSILILAGPVGAASLGISPSHIELEVPAGGSAAADFKVYYFSGDLKISLVDIPLRVEPETIHIEASDDPVDIQVTIYGDESLSSQVYEGYVRFLGMSGGTVAVAVKVRATITNIVAGQPLLEKPGTEESPPPEELIPEQAPGPPAPSDTTEWPILQIVGIIAGAAVIITLIVVRSRRHRC